MKELKENEWYQILENHDVDVLVDLYNEYAQENRYDEIMPYCDDTIEMLCCGKSSYDIFMMGCCAEIHSYSDDWLMLDGYANIVSYSNCSIRDYILETSLYDMVEWLNENKQDLID